MASPLADIAQILVVDDDATSREMLRLILIKEGFFVLTAQNGREARSIAVQRRPDLIIMDINMPVEDGLTACAALKSGSQTADIPVIFISTDEDVYSKVNGFNAGGVDYITKPYQVLEVIARVRLHIRLSHAYKQVVSANLAQLKTLSEAQKHMLVRPDELPEAAFSVFYIPAQVAGGDFYDVIRAGAGVYDYIVADISGHHVGTSLPSASLKVLIRQNASMLFSPQENLQLVNRHLRAVLQEDQYATLIYARFNKARMNLTLLNAGHPSAIYQKAGGRAELIPQTGDALCLFDNVVVGVDEFKVERGDRLYLFSDGLVEYRDNSAIARRKGEAGLIDFINRDPAAPLAKVIAGIKEEWFPNGDSLVDDVVLLGFEIA